MGNAESTNNESQQNPHLKQSFTNILKNIGKLNNVLKDCNVDKPPSVNVTINGQNYRITFKNFKNRQSLEDLQNSKDLINDIEITKLDSSNNSIIDAQHSQKDIQNLNNINLQNIQPQQNNSNNNVSSSLFLNNHNKNFKNQNPNFTENKPMNEQQLNDLENFRQIHKKQNTYNQNDQSGIQIMESDNSQKENYSQYWQEPYFSHSKQRLKKPSQDKVFQPLGENNFNNIKAMNESQMYNQQVNYQFQPQNLQMISPTKAPQIPQCCQIQSKQNQIKQNSLLLNFKEPQQEFKLINGVKKSPNNSKQFKHIALNSHSENSTQCTTSINQQYTPYANNQNYNKNPNFVDNSQDTLQGHNSYFFQQKRPSAINQNFSNTGTHFKNKSEQNFVQTARNYNKTQEIYSNKQRTNSTSKSPFSSSRNVFYHSNIKNTPTNYNRSTYLSPNNYCQTSINNNTTQVSPRYFSQKQSQIQIPIQVLTPTKQPNITKIEGESAQKKQLIENLRKNIANNIEKLSNVLTIQQQIQLQQEQDIQQHNNTQSSNSPAAQEIVNQSSISNQVLMFQSQNDSQMINYNNLSNNNINTPQQNNLSGIQSKKLIFESECMQSKSLVTDSYDNQQQQQEQQQLQQQTLNKSNKSQINNSKQIQNSLKDEYDMETSLFSDHFQKQQLYQMSESEKKQQEIEQQQQEQQQKLQEQEINNKQQPQQNQQIFQDIIINPQQSIQHSNPFDFSKNSQKLQNNNNLKIEMFESQYQSNNNINSLPQQSNYQQQFLQNQQNQQSYQDNAINIVDQNDKNSESESDSSFAINIRKESDQNQLTEDNDCIDQNPFKSIIPQNTKNSIIQTDSIFINQRQSQDDQQQLEKSIQQFENSELHKQLEVDFANSVENRQSKNIRQQLTDVPKRQAFEDLHNSITLSQQNYQEIQNLSNQNIYNDNNQENNSQQKQEIQNKSKATSIFNKIKDDSQNLINNSNNQLNVLEQNDEEDGYKPCEDGDNNINLIDDYNAKCSLPTENDEIISNPDQDNNNDDNNNFYQDILQQYGSIIDNNNQYTSQTQGKNNNNNYKKQKLQSQPNSQQSSQQENEKSQKFDISPNTSHILTRNGKKDKKSEVVFIQYNNEYNDIIEESFVVQDESPEKSVKSQNINSQKLIENNSKEQHFDDIDDDVNLGQSQENVVIQQSVFNNNINKNYNSDKDICNMSYQSEHNNPLLESVNSIINANQIENMSQQLKINEIQKSIDLKKQSEPNNTSIEKEQQQLNLQKQELQQQQELINNIIDIKNELINSNNNNNINDEQTPQFKQQITIEDLKKEDIRGSQTIKSLKQNQNAQFIQDFWKYQKVKKQQKINKEKNNQSNIKDSQLISKEKKQQQLDTLNIIKTDSILQDPDQNQYEQVQTPIKNENNNNILQNQNTPIISNIINNNYDNSQDFKKQQDEQNNLKESQIKAQLQESQYTYDPDFITKMFESKRKQLEDNKKENSQNFDTTPQKNKKISFDQILISKTNEKTNKSKGNVLKSILCSGNKSKLFNNELSQSNISYNSKRVSFKLTDEQELQQRKGNFIKFLKKAKHKIDPNSLRLLRFNTIHLINVKPLSLRRGSTPSFMDYKNQKIQQQSRDKSQD